jgi:integrase
MIEKRMLPDMPVIKLYEEDNVRKGFIEMAQLNDLLEQTETDAVRDIIEFLYHSGWRQKEAKNFQWNWIDANMIKVPKEFSKNKQERRLPILGKLVEILERRHKVRRIDCPYVFHRSGRQIKSFRRAFRAAAKQIEHPALLPHDMRRSAVRNFRKAGLSETDGMMLSGHKTVSVYRRYDIRDDADVIAAMEKVQAHLKKEAENHKVVPLKRERA